MDKDPRIKHLILNESWSPGPSLQICIIDMIMHNPDLTGLGQIKILICGKNYGMIYLHIAKSFSRYELDLLHSKPRYPGVESP